MTRLHVGYPGLATLSYISLQNMASRLHDIQKLGSARRVCHPSTRRPAKILGFQRVQRLQPARPCLLPGQICRRSRAHLITIFSALFVRENRPITSVVKHSKFLHKVELGSTLRNILPQLATLKLSLCLLSFLWKESLAFSY